MSKSTPTWQEIYQWMNDVQKKRFDRYVEEVGPYLLSPNHSLHEEIEFKRQAAVAIWGYDQIIERE